MRYTKAKLFYDNHNKIVCVEYDENKTDYYSFVSDCRKQGLHQIIISSEMMIDIIKEYYLEYNYKVNKIELMEEDPDIEVQVHQIIENIEKNPYRLSELVEFLKYIAERSSIEIKRIYIRNRHNSGDPTSIFIQSNGIVGINTETFREVSEKLILMVAGFFSK